MGSAIVKNLWFLYGYISGIFYYHVHKICCMTISFVPKLMLLYIFDMTHSEHSFWIFVKIALLFISLFLSFFWGIIAILVIIGRNVFSYNLQFKFVILFNVML